MLDEEQTNGDDHVAETQEATETPAPVESATRIGAGASEADDDVAARMTMKPTPRVMTPRTASPTVAMKTLKGLTRVVVGADDARVKMTVGRQTTRPTRSHARANSAIPKTRSPASADRPAWRPRSNGAAKGVKQGAVAPRSSLRLSF